MPKSQNTDFLAPIFQPIDDEVGWMRKIPSRGPVVKRKTHLGRKGQRIGRGNQFQAKFASCRRIISRDVLNDILQIIPAAGGVNYPPVHVLTAARISSEVKHSPRSISASASSSDRMRAARSTASKPSKLQRAKILPSKAPLSAGARRAMASSISATVLMSRNFSYSASLLKQQSP